MTDWRLQQNLQTMNMTSQLIPVRFSFMTTAPQSWTMANWIHLPISTFDSLRWWWLRKSTSHLNDKSRSSYKFCLGGADPDIEADLDLQQFFNLLCKNKERWHYAILKVGWTNPGTKKQACGKKLGEVAGFCVPALGRPRWGGWSNMGRLTLGLKQNGTGETKFKWDSSCFLLRSPLL